MLSANDIHVSYNGGSKTFELSGVSLTISPGQITAIVGPNGSGKSTLIRAMSRVLHPIRGSVQLDGQNLYTDVSARAASRSISVTPQDTHVAFEFNARELIAMGRVPHQDGWELFAGESTADQEAIDRALTSAQITVEQSLRPAMTLSGGERQRVLLARSLAQDADFLLFDEPTSSLDLSHQALLFSRLLTLAHENLKAVVVVLHDLNQAAALADRIVVLNQGKVVADGTVSEVLKEDLISAVYDCPVKITFNYSTGKTMVVADAPRPNAALLAGLNIYVICGGGGGAAVLRHLTLLGACVHAGYLTEGDIDLLAARDLNLTVNALPAFGLVPQLNEREAASIADSHHAVVFSPAGIGLSNENALDAVVKLERAGAEIYASSEIDGYLRSASIVSKLSSHCREIYPQIDVIVYEDVKSLSSELAGALDA